MVASNDVYPMIFFLTFWCFVVLILLNVLLALILEIYSSIEPEVTMKQNKMKLAMQLSDFVAKADWDQLHTTVSEVRKKLIEIEAIMTEESKSSQHNLKRS